MGLAAGSSRAADTLVAANAACRYLVPANNSVDATWTARTFNDVAWSNGISGLGYDNELTYTLLFGTTVTNTTIDIYVRYAFAIPSEKNYNTLTLQVKYDDGFIAYLNGTEVARANAPANALYNSIATAGHDDGQAVVFQDFDISSAIPKLITGTNVLAVHALNISGSSDMLIQPVLVATLPGVVENVIINEFMADNSKTRANSLEKFEDWVELYNPNASSVNLSGWYLTDDVTKPTQWKFPVGFSTIPGNGYLLVWADSKSYSVTNNELHANFSLKASGEYLSLLKPDGTTIVSSFEAIQQYPDMSYGIGLTGEIRYFAVPTPLAVNNFDGGSNEVEGVKFSLKRGVFTNTVPAVTVTTDTSGATIRYTTNAEPPTASSLLYSTPFLFTKTAIIRANAYKTGFAPSDIDTHTYIVVADVLNQSATPAGWPTSWKWVNADYGMNQTIVAASRAALTNALKALPTLSIVTTQSNLFDTDTGIYSNPQGDDDSWERVASAEWIDTDNNSRFQIDCGLRIQGGSYFRGDLSLKKSLALRFRSEYGEGRLEETLFSGNAVSSFNDLVLRAGANDAWNKWGGENTQYIIDEYVRRTHLDMGGVSPHGTFVQLYLNGLYWGLYNVTERVTSEFAAAYYGGSEDTWDALSSTGPVSTDSNLIAWNAMRDVLKTNPGSDATYQMVQGNNSDGTRNPSYPVYLDVENYIDYMLLNYWSANDDWPGKNYRMFRDRNDSASTGFKFGVWDAEWGMGIHGGLETDTTENFSGVAEIQGLLLSNAEYKLRFADRVQKHLFNNGALTPAVAKLRYQELAALVEPAIVAESARWGDMDGNSSHTVAEWRTRRDYLLNTFMTQRGPEVLQHFKNRGLYPAVDAPVFSQFGGLFPGSLNLAITAANPVYYTTDGRDPRQYGSGAATGTLYSAGVALTRTTRVKARARAADGTWSALTEAVFTPAEKPALRVTELMFHPRKPVSGLNDGDDEFIELQNAGATTIGLAGLNFTQGVAFDFASSAIQTLAPGEYLLLVKNLAAFTNRYPSVSTQKIAGVFAFPSTSLDDAGEKVELQDAQGRAVVSFTYNNKWLPATDGAGHSLIPMAGVAQSDGELDYPGNWKASVYIGGSPGTAEPAAPAASLVLNEILAHTDYTLLPPYDSNDAIELYNVTAAPITLGAGWYLSDDPGNLTKWAIPATNNLAAHGWRYFDEIHDFHSPITNGFGLNKSSEQVLLSYLPGTTVDRVVDAVSFKGEENSLPLVRYPDGASPWVYGVSTPGASNRLTNAGMVISEIMYHPRPTVANPENNENDEFVELYNPTLSAITLMNLVVDVGAWRLAGGIDYLFPINTVVPAGGRLAVVSFDPTTNSAARAAFLAAYGLTNGQVRLFGPYSGQLNNKTDTVRLERPVNPDVVGEEVSWHVIDGVTYYDDAPWTTEADGTGRSLARLPGQNSGDNPASWAPGLSATPGRGPAKIAVTVPTADSGWLAPALVGITATVDSAFIVGPITQVALAVDGVVVTNFTAAPYTASITLPASEGERRLTARLTDSEGVYTSPDVVVMVYTNVPEFTTVLDQKINLTVTNGVNLHAAATLKSGMTHGVRFVWSCPGSGSVLLANPTLPDAAASFTQPGTYELVLTMYYGQLATNHLFTVTVLDANTTNSVPYRESFEGYELGTTLAGINGWYGIADNAIINTNTAASAAGGNPLTGTHGRSLSFKNGVTNVFGATGALTNICMDMLLACTTWMTGDAPAIQPEKQFAAYVNTNRNVVVWHGQVGSTNRWTVLPNTAVGSNTFVRLTLQADYSRDVQGSFGFRLWINRVAVTNPVSVFQTACTNRNNLNAIVLAGVGQVDDLVVSAYNSMLYRRITSAAGPHGKVMPAGDVLVPLGTATNIAVVPDSFYSIGAVTVDGTSAGAVTNYAFANVQDEHALSAGFLAKLTGSGVPEFWLNQINPAWTTNFEVHAQADQDHDGVPNGDEYVAGTDATNALSVFRLQLGMSNGMSVVSFPTVPAGGFYGLGGTRRYALEQTTNNLTVPNWKDVTGLDNVTGAGQIITYTNQLDAAAMRFFRGRVWLE